MNCTLQVHALTGTPKSCLTNHRSQEELTRNVRSPCEDLTPLCSLMLRLFLWMSRISHVYIENENNILTDFMDYR